MPLTIFFSLAISQFCKVSEKNTQWIKGYSGENLERLLSYEALINIIQKRFKIKKKS